MNKKIAILIAFLSINAFGQLKKITLEESVLQQGRKFGADKLTGFQWIPNTNKYVYYTDAWTKMMTATTADAKTSELTTLADINAALGTKLKNFFGVQWIDANTILVTENRKSYSYNLSTKKKKNIADSPENGENQTFDSAFKNLAFT